MENEDEKLLGFLLASAERVEMAAAQYGPAGRVVAVQACRVKPGSLAEYRRAAGWLRHKNAQGCNIWVRPADAVHPFVMLDDLLPARAVAVARKYRCAAVETSPGSAQLWLVMSCALPREQRQDVAKALCALVGADPCAVGEPRWGRLPGYRQRKPGKCGMTRLLAISADGPALDPAPYLSPSPAPARAAARRGLTSYTRSASDESKLDESKREFAFACHSLRAGASPDSIASAIAARALARGKRRTEQQALSYARHTVQAAQARLWGTFGGTNTTHSENNIARSCTWRERFNTGGGTTK
jgi:hypothetical protein